VVTTVQSPRRRQLRFLGTLILAAVVLGLVYGVLIGTVGQPDALLTWWGTCLRAVLAVVICSTVAQEVDRRLDRRQTDDAGHTTDPDYPV
jgi:hypothetical protein